MSGVAMETLTLPEAKSQFKPFGGHFFFFKCNHILRDDVITSCNLQYKRPDRLGVSKLLQIRMQMHANTCYQC